MGDRDRKDALFAEFARVGKALANPKRLELLDLLAQGERAVEALARAAGLSVTLTSAHLQTLRQAGLLAARKDGTRVLYRLAGADVAALYASVRAVAAEHLPDVAAAAAAYLGADDCDEIDRTTLLARLGRGAIVLDVRPAEEYAAGHIPGAICIPIDQLPDRLAEIPADADVLAHEAVRYLTSQGRRAARLADGMLEWRLADLPVAAGAA
jgi:DNA-binding transcriptional ArsR family regulator/rhodanese-related sulfurtransferase